MNDNRIYLNPEAAIALLPEGNEIHTFINIGISLVGADWIRDDLIMKIRSVDYREVTGRMARSMKHGLALYRHGDKHDDVLFVETNMEKLDKLYPLEEEDPEE